MNSEEIKLEIQHRIEEGRKKLLEEVAAQLEKEKEAALLEAMKKAVWLPVKFYVFIIFHRFGFLL